MHIFMYDDGCEAGIFCHMNDWRCNIIPSDEGYLVKIGLKALEAFGVGGAGNLSIGNANKLIGKYINQFFGICCEVRYALL